MAKHIFVLNGPNLNLLGKRQPEIYGHETLGDIEQACKSIAGELGATISFFQTNHEGELIDLVQKARDKADGIIINPAAYTHTSIALMDALLACEIPVIEVHLSNIHKREEFRHQSFVSKAASGVICGLGSQGYLLAIQALSNIFCNGGE